MTARDADLPIDTGKRPDFAGPAPGLGAVGTGKGYSGQEYDAPGQAEWRAGQAGRTASPDGAVHGSGAGQGTGGKGEELDNDPPPSR